MSFEELVRYLRSELTSIGIEEAEAIAEAEIIVSTLSNLSLTERMKVPTRAVSPELKQRAEDLLSRRRKREPLQYCLGETYFYGMRFLVRQGVLIPRADTETLVDTACKYFSRPAINAGWKPALPGLNLSLLPHSVAARRHPGSPLLIGEIGCGTGIISISLLKQFPEMKIEACDIELAAVELTRENAALHKLNSRLHVVCQDWRDWLQSLPEPLDGLLANPPYIPRSLSDTLEAELGWEPELALFGGGDDGLNFYREFAELAAPAFSPGARIFLEIGAGQANAVTDIFCVGNWSAAGMELDLNGIARVLSFMPPNSPF